MIQYGNVIEQIFGTFPREIGLPRRFVQSRNEFYELVNAYNGYCNLYSSVYSLPTKKDYYNAIVDKIYIDLDNLNEPLNKQGIPMTGKKKCWEATKKFHKYLVKKDLKHLVILSGNGFNIYIYVKPIKLNNPKEALRGAMRNLAESAGLTIGKPQTNDIDEHIVGDTARISRIPNTWHLKAKRFAIPLVAEDFERSYGEICVFAARQRFEFEVFGNKLLDLIGFDRCAPMEEIAPVDIEEEIDADISQFMVLLPPFLVESLKTGMCKHFDRYLQIIGSREMGIPLKVFDEIAQTYWTPEKYEHAKRECGRGQIEYLYGRTNLRFPKWETLERKGYHITKEDKKFKFYK